MEKIINYPQIGLVTLRKKVGNRIMRICVHPRKGVTVSLPWLVPFSRGISFLEEKKGWVLDTMKKQALRIEEMEGNGKVIRVPRDNRELEALRRKARRELVPRLEFFARSNGFTDQYGNLLYRRVAIRNNVSNWGSCSGKNNINLNMRLVLLPAHLQDYVLLHELCHLKHHNHGAEFHRLMDSLCVGHEKSLRSELREWRLM